jgi:uncharacterized membrane protein
MATSAEPTPVTLTFPLGCDVVVRGTLGSDVTGYTFGFYILDRAGATVLSKTSGSGIAIVTAATGIVDVTFTEANTEALTAGTSYRWAWWRTNAGAAHKLAGGSLEVTPAPEYDEF